MGLNQKVATAVAAFVAVVMLCGGVGYIGYNYGYRTGHETSSDQRYDQVKSGGRLAAYESGLEVGGQSKVNPGGALPGALVLRNPTYQETRAFLAQDPTNLNKYQDETYVCVDFAAAVTNHALAKGIRCATVDIFYPSGYGHTIVAFDTTDKGVAFFEPQFDQEVKLVVGRSYSAINGFTPAPRDDTIKRFVIVW